MAGDRRGQRTHRSTDGPTVATVGRLGVRVGVAVVATALPLALVTFLLVLAGSPTLPAGVEAAMAAASGPLTAGGGVRWLFHVGVLGTLAGCWMLGAALVLSGLAD